MVLRVEHFIVATGNGPLTGCHIIISVCVCILSTIVISEVFYFNLFFRRADEALLAHIGGPRHPRLDWNRWRTHRVRSGGHNNSTQPIESYKISTFSWASLPRLSGSNRRRCFGSDAWRVVSRLNTVRCVAAAIHGHLFGLHLSELCLPFKSHYFGQDQRRNRPAQLWAGTYRKCHYCGTRRNLANLHYVFECPHFKRVRPAELKHPCSQRRGATIFGPLSLSTVLHLISSVQRMC